MRRRNRPGQADGRTDGQIFYGRTGPDRRPLYNLDQRSLVSLSVSGQSVCDGDFVGDGAVRDTTVPRFNPPAETQVLRARSWSLALRAWNPGPDIQVLKPRVEGLKPRVEFLKPRSWDPGPETSRWGPETQVLISRSWNLALRSWNPALIGGRNLLFPVCGQSLG